MSHSIIYQSMCVVFPNQIGVILTQLGDSNCTQFELTGKRDRRYREVLARDWQTLTWASKEGNCLVDLKELTSVIHSNLMTVANGNLDIDSCVAYKTRYAFKPYSFIENHLRNAITRYSITAENLLKRYNPLKVCTIGSNNVYNVTSVQELYMLLSQVKGAVVFNLPYALEVNKLVSDYKSKPKECYYIYNFMDNTVLNLTGRRGKNNKYIWDTLKDSYKANNVTLDAETWLQQSFGTKILIFKSVEDTLKWIIDQKSEYLSKYGVCVGQLYKDNPITPEYEVSELLKKFSNFD